jgi:hypothetical protein
MVHDIVLWILYSETQIWPLSSQPHKSLSTSHTALACVPLKVTYRGLNCPLTSPEYVMCVSSANLGKCYLGVQMSLGKCIFRSVAKAQTKFTRHLSCPPLKPICGLFALTWGQTSRQTYPVLFIFLNSLIMCLAQEWFSFNEQFILIYFLKII